MSSLRKAKDGGDLPDARRVSFTINPDQDRPHYLYTTMLMQWGQFIDHDFALTAISKISTDPSGMWFKNKMVVELWFSQQDRFSVDSSRVCGSHYRNHCQNGTEVEKNCLSVCGKSGIKRAEFSILSLFQGLVRQWILSVVQTGATIPLRVAIQSGFHTMILFSTTRNAWSSSGLREFLT